MSTETELPADVIAEIEANRKVSAIKRLRSHRGIGLKEAKEIVDTYTATHTSSPKMEAPGTDGGIGRILLLIIGVGVIYAIYRYFF